jgi:hypothetical protein
MIVYKSLSCEWLIDWLIDYLRFYVLLKNFTFIWRRHHCQWWWAVKFRPKLGAQGLWARSDLYRATPTVTRDLGFSGLIRRTAQFSRLLRHTRGSGGSILTRILTGPLYVTSYDTQGDAEDLFLPGPPWAGSQNINPRKLLCKRQPFLQDIVW